VKVKVHMLAFMEGQIREIAIPDFKPTRGVELRILTYKAPLHGKVVETVDPRNTSKDDHRGIKQGKRLGCRYYASFRS